MSKPAFVFIPGGWLTSDVYDGVISRLHNHGYDSVKVELPSLGGKPPAYDFSEDVNIIKETASDLIALGKDVVMVAHGFSGQSLGEMPLSMSKSDRESKQLKGGIIRLVFVTANLVPENYQLAKRPDLSMVPSYIKTDTETSTITIMPDDVKHLWFHDLSDEEASRWAAKAIPHSIGVFWSKSTRAAWRYIPSTFVFCREDRFFHYAEIQIADAKSTSDHMLDSIEEVDAGHYVMLSQPEWLTGVLIKAAGGERSG